MGEPTAAWTNWAGTYSVTPARIAHPRSPDEVATEIRRAAEGSLSIKAIGSGHSFTDIGVTRGTLLYLNQLRGIIAADPVSGLVTVAAGTTLHEPNDALWELGLSMTNLGDIDVQTISGAISTGTHGTGKRFGGIATQVCGLQLATADGNILDCSATENADVFDAARAISSSTGFRTPDGC
jgi:FAD/FMN-containing dehydrogenase